MQKVIFQSLYADPGMSSLKHALFYFGKVRIPKSPFIYLEDESKFIRYVMPVPEHALEHVRHLEQQGYIEFEDEVGDPARLYDMIQREGMRAGRTFKYRDVDLMPLYRFLDISPEDPNPTLLQAFNHGIVFLAAQALGGVALGHGLPCVDNPVLFDLMNLGLRGIFQDFIDKHGFSPSEIQELKAQYLGQHLVTLFLQSFQFRSFDDVLEAREKTRDQLFALRARVEQLASEMSSAPWDRDYDAEVAALVKRHVEPQVEELRKAASFSLARVVRRMTTAAVCVTLQSMLPDTVAPYLLGASALSLVEAIRQERESVRTARLSHAFRPHARGSVVDALARSRSHLVPKKNMKKTTKKWKGLESLAATIQRSMTPTTARVEQNVYLPGKLSGRKRQIDIAIWNRIGQFETPIIIDCKDYEPKVDVKDVEMFIGLVSDVGANQGAIVAIHGYTETAKRRAENAGLRLFTLVDAESEDWPAFVSLPTVVDEGSMAGVNYSVSSTELREVSATGLQLQQVFRGDGTPMGSFQDLVCRRWDDEAIPHEPGMYENLPVSQEPTFFRTEEGLARVELTASIRVVRQEYFGYLPLTKVQGFLDDLEGSLITRSITTDVIDVRKIRDSWRKIASEDEIAVRPTLRLKMEMYYPWECDDTDERLE